MTINVRYDTDHDGVHAWRHRRDLVFDTIRAHQPDLLGLQEPTVDQWNEIADAFPDLTNIDGDKSRDSEGDQQGGLIRRQRFELRARGVFSLTDTSQAAGA